uniref:Cytochrome c oxidase assembly protein COX16 homolog, mitochondrial n=1 Tax=Accipiter nisus TaxID=211598 RepID=A0A8B9M806_9AVES
PAISYAWRSAGKSAGGGRLDAQTHPFSQTSRGRERRPQPPPRNPVSPGALRRRRGPLWRADPRRAGSAEGRSGGGRWPPGPMGREGGGWMERLRKLWRGRTMTFGVPLLLYLVGGSFGLREFAQIRYDVHKLHGKVDPALKEKLKQNTVTLESEYEVK